MGDVMDFCNYLYNVSLLELFIEIGRQITRIKPGYFGFWILFGSDYIMSFDKNRISHDFSFEYVFVKFPPTEFLQIIPYNRDMKEMKLLWYSKEG